MKFESQTKPPLLKSNLFHKSLVSLLKGYGKRDFAIELWDGSRIEPDQGQEERFCLRINYPDVIDAITSASNFVELGDIYLEGGLDISGDLIHSFELAYYLMTLEVSWRIHTLGKLISFLPRKNKQKQAMTRSGIRSDHHRVIESVNSHYDMPFEFWQLWLDERMQYTCGYFKSSDDSINQAQLAKIDLICRKLRLQEGERFLDLGCGWGGLLLHAVREYGVIGYGVTLSHHQADYVQQQIKHYGLQEQCSVVVSDFRDFVCEKGFDKIAGVGIIEHVGETMHLDYFRKVWELARERALFFNQGICCSSTFEDHGGSQFLDNHIFPDHELVPIYRTLEVAGEVGWDIRHSENLRDHYVLTLKRWLELLELHADRVQDLVGTERYKAFRVYLAGMAHDFARGGIHLFQTLFAKSPDGKTGLPLTPEDWHVDSIR